MRARPSLPRETAENAACDKKKKRPLWTAYAGRAYARGPTDQRRCGWWDTLTLLPEDTHCAVNRFLYDYLVLSFYRRDAGRLEEDESEK